MLQELLQEEFGTVVKKLREERKLSQMQLANQAGLHLNGLGNLERGDRSPTLYTVFRIAEGLGIPPEKLVAEVGEKVRKKLRR